MLSGISHNMIIGEHSVSHPVKTSKIDRAHDKIYHMNNSILLGRALSRR